MPPHPRVVEMREKSEPVFRLVLKLYRDPRKRSKAVEVFGKYVFAEISTRRVLEILRGLEKN